MQFLFETWTENVIDPKSYQLLREEIKACLAEDQLLLNQLRIDISPLKLATKKIQPHSTTSIALVATDGGNNKLKFDPFLVQLVRVVDSSNNEYCLSIITPSTNIDQLSKNQFNLDGTPKTALGQMMNFLGVSNLTALSPMIYHQPSDKPKSLSWIQVYRELVEWAILFAIVKTKDFATDTLIVFDGLLRSKVFSKDLFQKLRQGFSEAIEKHKREKRRNIYLVGVAKHSKVLDRYRLAMAIEEVMHVNYPCYVEISRELEKKSYIWEEYSIGDDNLIEGKEINKFVSGKMFLVKFGAGKRDPIWPVDIFTFQVNEASTILGCMLEDARNGFPIPYYPHCLQKAHGNAALTDFDFNILQDEVIKGLRLHLEEHWPALDVLLLQSADPSSARYE